MPCVPFPVSVGKPFSTAAPVVRFFGAVLVGRGKTPAAMSSLSQSALRTTNGRQRLVLRKEDDGHEGHCDRELEFLIGADLGLGQGWT